MKATLAIVVLTATAVGLAVLNWRIAPTVQALPKRPEPASIERTERQLEPAPAKAPPVAPSFDWRTIESPDYKVYIANLRAIGCPEHYIRDIILADINKLYAPREEPLKARRVGVDQSRSPQTRAQWSAERQRMEQLRAVQLEKRALVRELLGVQLPLDVVRSTGYRNYEAAEAAFNQIPPDKRDAVQTIQEDYWQASDALQEQYPNRGPEFLELYKKLNADKEAALARVLTPAEADDYEMRTQPTGTELTRRLTGMEVSEGEFKAIWRLRKEYEEATGRVKGLPDAQVVSREGRAAAREQFNARLKELLGPTRFREYEMTTDDTFHRMRNLGQRYGLAMDSVTEAYDVATQLNQLRQVPNRNSPEATARQLQSGQLQQRLSDLLGSQAYFAWKNFGNQRVNLDP